MKNELRPPPALGARVVTVDDEEFVVFSWSTTELVLPESLTEAERDVLRRWLEGASALEVARARRVSVRTVQNQLRAIYQKLGVSSRGEIFNVLARRAEGPPT